MISGFFPIKAINRLLQTTQHVPIKAIASLDVVTLASPNGATLIKPGATPQESPNGATLKKPGAKPQESPNRATLIKPGATPLDYLSER